MPKESPPVSNNDPSIPFTFEVFKVATLLLIVTEETALMLLLDKVIVLVPLLVPIIYVFAGIPVPVTNNPIDTLAVLTVEL